MRRRDQFLRAGLAVRLLGTRRPADLEAAGARRNKLNLPLTLEQRAFPVRFRGPNCSHLIDSSRSMFAAYVVSSCQFFEPVIDNGSRCPNKHLCRLSTTLSAAMRPSWRW